MVSISGAHSSAGKTTVAEHLLRALPGRWAAVKYTKTAFYTSVSASGNSTSEDGKDTARLLKAGATQVQWVQAPYQELGEALNLALSAITGVDGILVEGNSPMDFMEFDCTVFVFGEDPPHLKEGSQKALQRASVVVVRDYADNEAAEYELKHMDSLRGKRLVTVPSFVPSPLAGTVDGRLWDAPMTDIVDAVWSGAIDRLLLEYSVQGTISCATARMIADRAGDLYGVVGTRANALKIKIKECQLGCF